MELGSTLLRINQSYLAERSAIELAFVMILLQAFYVKLLSLFDSVFVCPV